MDFIEKLDGAITVTNEKGEIIYMNEKADKVFQKDGGRALYGSNLMDCHSETSRKKIEEIIRTGQNNAYTIEKNGKKKLIFQTPWISEGEYKGLVEISLEIPFEMQHFVRSQTA